MNQIKIGLTGVHASGKTRKAKELSEHYAAAGKSAHVVDEVARSCPLALDTIDAQEYIWHEQMRREKAAMAQDVDVIICDQVALGNLMYYRATIEDVSNRGETWMPQFFRWRQLYIKATDWMPTYDQVIRLPLKKTCGRENMKRGYQVFGRDSSWGVPVVAHTTKEAKKMAWASWEWINLRVHWRREARVEDMEFGCVDNPDTAYLHKLTDYPNP